MRGVRGAGFQDEEPGAIGADDLVVQNFQVYFWVAVGAVAAVAGDLAGFGVDCLGACRVRGIRHCGTSLVGLAG